MFASWHFRYQIKPNVNRLCVQVFALVIWGRLLVRLGMLESLTSDRVGSTASSECKVAGALDYSSRPGGDK